MGAAVDSPAEQINTATAKEIACLTVLTGSTNNFDVDWLREMAGMSFTNEASLIIECPIFTDITQSAVAWRCS